MSGGLCPGDYVRDEGLCPSTFATTRLDTEDTYENTYYYIIHFTKYSFLVFLATYSRTVSSNESFLAMSFSIDNMHKEFKRSSVMVARDLFFIKDSFEKFLSASQLVIGIVKYSLSAVVKLGNTSIRCCSQIS